jgi:hypothetical protein
VFNSSRSFEERKKERRKKERRKEKERKKEPSPDETTYSKSWPNKCKIMFNYFILIADYKIRS